MTPENPEIPNSFSHEVDVRVHETLAAKVIIYFYPSILDSDVVYAAADMASEYLAEAIAEGLNENEGREQ